MATSGSKSVSVASGLTLKFNWSQSSQSVANNSTTVSWNLQVILASGYSISSSASKDWSVTVNGKTYSGSNSFGNMGSGATKTMASGSTTITHNADGSKQFSYSFSQEFAITFNGSSIKTISGSGSGTLNTIARASSFTLSSSSLDMGGTQTVNITRASSSFTHTIAYTFGSNTTTVTTKNTSTGISFTLPVSLASQIPNSTSGTCTVKVTTYNGSTAIGSATKTFTLKVPSSVKPTVTALNPVYNNTLNGLTIAGKSTVTITPVASGSYGSSITSYSYNGAGLTGTGSTKTTGTLSSGTYTITVTATDSRGRTNSASLSFTTYAYSNPSVSASVYRCNSDGTTNSSGTYARFRLSWNISNPNGQNKNLKQYRIEWKRSTSTTWSVSKDWTNLGAYSATNYVVDCGSGWNTSVSYDVRVTVKDSYTTASVTSTIGTISCIFNVEPSGVGVGKMYERGALDVNGHVYATTYTGSGNGKNIVMGTGSSDVYIHNTVSGRFLQLKDNGTLAYSDAPILMGTMSSSGHRWGVFTNIGGDGVMEVGKYLDFHESDGDTSDYALRLTSSGGNLLSSGHISPNNNATVRFGYSSSEACTYIANNAGNWLRLTDDGVLKWRGWNILHSNGTHSISGTLKTGSYANSYQGVTFKRKTDDIGNYLGKIGCSVIGSTEPTVTIEVGKVSDTSNDSFANGFRRFSFGSSHFLTHTNNAVDIGSSNFRFKSVYATNGTIQTSDGRYKYILEDVDSQTCYDLIKDMNLYGYSTLNKRIDEYVNTTEISDELRESSQEDMNLHMGFIAQEIEDSELAKYILIKDELEDEDGKPTGEHIYSVDNYAYTTTIHSALKHEIEIRDAQIEEKDRQIEELNQRIARLEELLLN
jgi:hypothetical protein